MDVVVGGEESNSGDALDARDFSPKRSEADTLQQQQQAKAETEVALRKKQLQEQTSAVAAESGLKKKPSPLGTLPSLSHKPTLGFDTPMDLRFSLTVSLSLSLTHTHTQSSWCSPTCAKRITPSNCYSQVAHKPVSEARRE